MFAFAFWRVQTINNQLTINLYFTMAETYVPTISSGTAGPLGVVHLPLLTVSDEIRKGQLVHLLPSWAPKRYVVHAVYPSKRGLLPSVRALLDYLGARFSELRED